MLRGTRTVIERVRYEGVARCSRTFEENGAARVMLSQLGPGVVRGDRIEIVGTVARDAHLIVTEQTATRILGGAAPSSLSAHWTVEAGAWLEFRAEPIVSHHGGDHEITTRVACERDATVMLREVVSVTNGARLRMRTLVTIAGRDCFSDAIELDDTSPAAVGTFAVLGRSVAPQSFDAIACASSEARIGIGTLHKGIFARAIGPRVWVVRAALDELRAALDRAEEVLVAPT